MRYYETYVFESVYDSPKGDAVETFSKSNIWDALMFVAREHCGMPSTVRTLQDLKDLLKKEDISYGDVVEYMAANNENLLKLTNTTTGVTYFG